MRVNRPGALPLAAVLALVSALAAPPGATAGALEPAFHLFAPEPGVDAVHDVAALPLLRLGGRTVQLASADPAGGNEDGFAGHSELYVDERGEHVVFDDFGPGCVYRLWLTAKLAWLGRIRVYVDDLEHPVVDERLLDLFGGERPPFVAPLVLGPRRSSGGFVSYVPICYEQRAKITLSRPAEFYGVTYRRYDTDHRVRSFAADLDVAALAEAWRHPERDPKPGVASERSSGRATIAPGEARDLLDARGAGAVWNLALTIEPPDERAGALWLAARWDGHPVADVEAPVSLFFGSARTDRDAAGLLFGRHGGRYVSRFPMPFWSAAEIRIENRGPAPVTVAHEVELTRVAYPDASGYFTAIHHSESPTTVGRDYRFAEVAGAGHFIGASYAMRGSILGTYMEGDERFHVDGAATPALHGTGTEDYFNGGWYFLFGRFSAPLHGAPYRLSPTGLTTGETGAYRVHLGDLVSFVDGARFAIEHDRADEDTDDEHESVAYLYRRGEPLVTWTDAVDVGDPSSEATHGYTSTDAAPTPVLDSVFEGDDDDVRVRDSGRDVRGSSRFTVAISALNEGVVLRRRFDRGLGRQTARVRVDGQAAGIWYDVRSNPVQRWAESDFWLARSLTAGKSQIAIELVNIGPVPWNEHGYRVATVRPPG